MKKLTTNKKLPHGLGIVQEKHSLTADEIMAALQQDPPSLDGHKRGLALMMLANIQTDLNLLKELLMYDDEP
jgi:hypothetical protein